MFGTIHASPPVPWIDPHMTETEQYHSLSAYMEPRPGGIIEVPSIHPNAPLAQTPMHIEGSIQLKPPKGVCFLVRFDRNSKAERICEHRPWRFRLNQLQKNGSLKLLIRIIHGEKESIEFDFYWPSKHRIATLLPHGAPKTKLLPIQNCHRSTGGLEILLFNGSKWTIKMPNKDELIQPQPKSEPKPNLLIDPYDLTPNDVYEDHSILFKKYWHRSSWRAFQMQGGQFFSAELPPGKNGVCRYQLRNPSDPKLDGWIECKDLDSFDALFIPLVCG
jgi:hypothetical protein